MKNAFLIVNCNDYKSTLHLVNNIKGFKCLDEIIVVDNNSTEKEKENLASLEKDNVHIIYNSSNDGYSSAINIGSRYLVDKYKECNIFVSNSDVIIMSEEDLIKMIKYIEDCDIGLVGPQVLEQGEIHRGVKALSPLVDFLLTVPLVRTLVSDNAYLYSDSHYETDISYVDVISSCFFLISSDTMQKINYMDELVFLYYEDFILGKKIQNMGLKVAVVNDVKIKHQFSVSVDKIIKDTDKYKLLKKSQFYYHTTYNNANIASRLLLKTNAFLGIVVRKIKDIFAR